MKRQVSDSKSHGEAVLLKRRDASCGGSLETPLVTVIIPTYNHAHYLPQSLGSVLNQTYSARELVVVDDGSQDDTHEVVQNYDDGSIRYLCQRNRGLAAARNRGLSEAQGEFVAFLDADDRLLPDHLLVSVDALQKHPDAAFVCGDLRTFGAQDDFVHVHECSPAPDHFASMLRGCFIVNVGACLFHRSALLAIGGFDETRKACEDWDLFFRILRHSSLHCHHQVVLEYRRSSGQMSRDYSLMLDASMRVLRDQRIYTRNRQEYNDSYKAGLSDIIRYYGNPTVDALYTALRSLRFRQAVQLLVKLLRWYPTGLLRVFRHSDS